MARIPVCLYILSMLLALPVSASAALFGGSDTGWSFEGELTVSATKGEYQMGGGFNDAGGGVHLRWSRC